MSWKKSPSIPLVCVSSCRTVTDFVASASATANSGSTESTVASSSSSPASTSCITSVAVYTLLIDPTWNTESAVTATPVPRCNTPVATSCTCPSTSTANDAPGTRRRRASSSNRPCHRATSNLIRTLPP